MRGKVSLVADALFRSNAIKFGCFKLKSGITSPYYIDLTWLLSSPEDFRGVVEVIAGEIRSFTSESGVRIDKLASIELKGALILPSVAERLNMPCVIVRKEVKTYGLTGRIVGGEVKEGDHILFFDDLITDGRSKVEGIKPLERMGADVKLILVVVDREQGGRENLERMGYKFRSIVKISEVVRSLMESGKLKEERAMEILNYIRRFKVAS